MREVAPRGPTPMRGVSPRSSRTSRSEPCPRAQAGVGERVVSTGDRDFPCRMARPAVGPHLRRFRSSYLLFHSALLGIDLSGTATSMMDGLPKFANAPEMASRSSPYVVTSHPLQPKTSASLLYFHGCK